MPNWTVALVAVVCVLGPLAESRAEQPADARMTYALLETSIECLYDAGLARDTLQGVKLVGNTVADSYATMTAHRSVIRRFKGCRSQLEGIKPASESGVTAVKGMRAAFDALTAGFQRSLRLDEKIITMNTEEELRGVVPEASEVSDNIDAAWRILPIAASAVCNSLVDDTRPSAANTINRLQLTRKQISEAKAYLLKLFPQAAMPRRGDRHVVDFSASLLAKFFSSKWLAADEP